MSIEFDNKRSPKRAGISCLACALLVLYIGSARVRAQETNAAPPVSTAGESTAAVAVDAHADTNAAPLSAVALLPERDPFWPVGYTKPEPRSEIPPDVPDHKPDIEERKPPVAPVPAIVWPELKVDSVAVSRRQSVALVNGIGMVQAGDKPELIKGGIVYRWLIVAISEKGLSYKRLDATPVGREDQRVIYTEPEEIIVNDGVQ